MRFCFAKKTIVETNYKTHVSRVFADTERFLFFRPVPSKPYVSVVFSFAAFVSLEITRRRRQRRGEATAPPLLKTRRSRVTLAVTLVVPTSCESYLHPRRRSRRVGTNRADDVVFAPTTFSLPIEKHTASDRRVRHGVTSDRRVRKNLRPAFVRFFPP